MPAMRSRLPQLAFGSCPCLAVPSQLTASPLLAWYRCAQVRLRRSIGMKKDDYYLDKKHIT